MGTGSAGRSVTIAFGGTIPVTSEVVIAAAGAAAAAGDGSLEPRQRLLLFRQQPLSVVFEIHRTVDQSPVRNIKDLHVYPL